MEWKLVVRDFSRWILLRLNIKTQKEFDEADEEESRGKILISQKLKFRNSQISLLQFSTAVNQNCPIVKCFVRFYSSS